MYLPVKAVCDRRSKKDGTNVISIQYCFSAEKRTVQSTGIAIPSVYWNKKYSTISEKLPGIFGKADDLNQRIISLIRRTEDIIMLAAKYQNDPLVLVKEYFSSERNIEQIELMLIRKQGDIKAVYTNLDFFFQIDEYIKSQIPKVSEHMPAVYRNMKMHLQEFEKFGKSKITFSSLNYDFYESLVEFLSYHYAHHGRKIKITGLKRNSVGKTIKQLRIFLNNRARKKIIPEIDVSGWTVLNEEVDAVYLTWGEIESVYSLDLSNEKYLIPYQRDFVLGCLTGLRFSDFTTIQATDFEKDRLRIKQQKSNTRVVIPLKEEAVALLKERFSSKPFYHSNQEFNKHIKTLAKMAGITRMVRHSHKKGNKKIVEVRPKYSWVTSHTCRRSFCTNEFLAGTPVELIMKISGHKSVKDFYKYIRITPEEAAKVMADLWKERGEMKAFSRKLATVA